MSMTHLISILIGFHIAYTSGSQPFMIFGPLPKTVNTCGPLLNRVLQYHSRAI